MGTWDVGPFDNDNAADWCGELQDAEPGQRPAIITGALRQAAGEEGYLECPEAAEAIAAAAVVAAALPGAEIVNSAYAPNFLSNPAQLELPATTLALAIAALDRIIGEHSEWRDLWVDSDSEPEALAVITSLREHLATAQ